MVPVLVMLRKVLVAGKDLLRLQHFEDLGEATSGAKVIESKVGEFANAYSLVGLDREGGEE